MSEQQPDERYFQLAEKWANGTITPEEMREYADWYNSIAPDASLDIPESVAEDREAHRRKILAALQEKINSPSVYPIKKRNRVVKIAVAASVLLLLGASAYVFFIKAKPAVSLATNLQVQDKAPGHAGAILTLANGKQVVLDSTANGVIAQQGTAQLAKQDDALAYQKGGAENTAATVAYNTLTTPRGRQFKVILPDGTQAWLNAASSITYPVAFSGAERKVSISGEVYFEVTKDKTHPFIVSAGSEEVKVLGTHFDVMAYSDESAMNTTLLEGSVQVTHGGQQVIIRPGEQASVSGNRDNIRVQQVDADESVAWVKGKLSLDNLDVKTILREVSRWYDVDVRFEGTIPDDKYWGLINRNANLSSVLSVMKANGINARLEGNTVIVSIK